MRELSGARDGPERAVERLGGEVGRHISIIDGFVARVPASGVELLEDLSGIHSLTSTAQELPAADPIAQGAGLVDLERVRDTATPSPSNRLKPMHSRLGSFEAARGSDPLRRRGRRARRRE